MVDEIEGDKLPCILVENKIDLLNPEENNSKNDKELEELAKKNGFIGCFKTSAKDGKNINEALNYLICDIINKIENMKLNNEKNADVEEERKSLALKSNIKDKEGYKTYNKTEESNEDSKKCYLA